MRNPDDSPNYQSGDENLMSLEEFNRTVKKNNVPHTFLEKIKAAWRGQLESPPKEIEIITDEIDPFPVGSHLAILVEIFQTLIGKVISEKKQSILYDRIRRLFFKEEPKEVNWTELQAEVQRILEKSKENE